MFALVDGTHACRSPRRRTTRPSATATPVPTPAAWAPIRRRPIVDPVVEARIMERIIPPTVAGMAAEGAPFKGVLYAGLMIDRRGPQAARVQRALRRSRMPGADAAAQVAICCRRLIAAPTASSSPSTCAGTPRPRCGRDGGQGLSRRLRQGQRDPQASRRPKRSRASACSMPAPRARTAAARRRSAAACSASPRAARPRAGAGARLPRRRPDRLARGLLPPRHRLARARRAKRSRARSPSPPQPAIRSISK